MIALPAIFLLSIFSALSLVGAELLRKKWQKLVVRTFAVLEVAGIVLLISITAWAQELPSPTVGDRILAEYQTKLSDAERRAIVSGAVAADLESRLKWVMDNWVPKTEEKTNGTRKDDQSN